MIRRLSRPLDPDAVQAANEKFRAINGDGPIDPATSQGKLDAAEWRQLYFTAFDQKHQQAREGDDDSDEEIGTAVETCPYAKKAACKKCWDDVHAERDQVLQERDPIRRNQLISQSYAKLYTEDSRLKWAGLAAIVSMNAGCAMENASQQSDLNYPYVSKKANTAYKAMANSNKEIFSDIYPRMRFYQKHGLEKLKECDATDGENTVPSKLMTGMAATERGETTEGEFPATMRDTT